MRCGEGALIAVWRPLSDARSPSGETRRARRGKKAVPTSLRSRNIAWNQATGTALSAGVSKQHIVESDQDIEHLLRRAGFGVGPDDRRAVEDMTASDVLDYLIDYERQPDDVDRKIGDSACLLVVPRSQAFWPNLDIEDAQQRWLFRMTHTRRPLQEKMALFWHNHFATAYGKLAVTCGTIQATKLLCLARGELPGPAGQIELFRERALGSYRDLLVEVARHPATIVWLDGRLNTRQRPQENFAREILELFTLGAGHYTEQDVAAAAKVFTGWNLGFVGTDGDRKSVV